MPMKQDPGHGGSEKDGSKSETYCSLCYRNGEFLKNDLKNAKEMQVFCIEKMQEQGMSKWMAWLLTRGIPRLKRWKK